MDPNMEESLEVCFGELPASPGGLWPVCEDRGGRTARLSAGWRPEPEKARPSSLPPPPLAAQSGREATEAMSPGYHPCVRVGGHPRRRLSSHHRP